MAYEFLVLELVETESVTPLRVVVVVLHIGNHALIYLQLYVFGRSILLLVLVHRLKVLAYYRAVRNHVGRECIAQGREHDAGDEVRAKESLEGNT